jgi:PAS domain S-box-containing protein
MFDIMIDLGENFAALLSLIFLFSFFSKAVLKNKFHFLPLIVGAMFGGAAIFGMLHPIKIVEGVIIDARVVLVALAGTFGGPLSGLIAALSVAGYRIYLGGAGTTAGVLVIIAAGMIGSFFSWEKIKNKKAYYRFWVLGVILAIVGLSTALLLPAEIIIPVLKKLSLPVLISYPLATVLFGTLFGFEITRQDTALELRESEARFRLLAENSTDMISRHDIQGNYLYASPACRALLGYEPEELIGHSAFEFIHPDDIPTVDQSRTDIIEQPVVSTTVFRVRRKSGEYVWLETTSRTISNKNTGAALEIHAASRDVTERKQAEDALRASEEKYRFLVENTTDVLWQMSPDFKFTYSSPVDERQRGYKPGEVVGKSIFDFMTPESKAEVLRIAGERQKQLQSGEKVGTYTYEIEQIRKDGQRIWTEVVSQPVYDEFGKLNFFQGVTRDITERKQAESQREAALEALQKSEARFRSIFEKSAAGYVLTSPEGRLLKVNAAMADMLGYTIDELQLVNFQNITHPDDIFISTESVRTLLAGECDVYRFEKRYLHRNGATVWTAVNTTLVHDSQNLPLYFITSITDITDHKRVVNALQESQTRYQLVFENSGTANAIFDTECRLVLQNGLSLQSLGTKPGEALGKTALEIFGPERGAVVTERMRRVLASGVTESFETQFNLPVGEKWFRSTYQPIFDEQQALVGIQVISQDVTERKRAEETLRESEERLQLVMEGSQLGYWDWNVETGEVRRNARWAEMLGYTLQEIELSVKQWTDLHHPDDREATWKSIQEHLEGKTPAHRIEYRMLAKNGQYKWILDQARVVKRDAQGKPLRMSGTHTDVTERKRAEEALRESEERLRLAHKATNDVVWDWDVLHDTQQWNEAGITVFGWREIVEHPVSAHWWAERIHPDDRQRVDAGFFQVVNDPATDYWHDEYRFRKADDSYAEVMDRGYVLRDTHGKAVRMIGAMLDITERKRAEQLIKEEEFYLTKAQEIGKLGHFSYDPVSGVVEGSAELFRIFDVGPSQLLFQAFANAIHPEDGHLIFPYIDRAVREGLPYAVEHRVRHKDGSVLYVHARGEIMYTPQGTRMIGIVQDITERRQAEEEIRQLNASLEQRVEERTRELRDAQERLLRNEKLAVLGQVAGSMGHELRNPLGVISNAVYFLKMAQADAPDKIKEYLNIIERETNISAMIVADLLDFARIESAQPKAVSLPDLIRQTLERFPAPESVQVMLDLPVDLPNAYTDPRHVIQVLGNLILNAYQAMASTKDAKLVIASRAQDALISIAVRDTGSGVSPENMEKLFEPLFTTRTKGIGLGLAVSKKLIEANGGRIEVESDGVPGKGSVFSVYLPIYQDAK